MADRIAVMQHGRVVQFGTPRQLYTRPESAFVAEFIGGTNLLPGILEERDDLLTVRIPAGSIRALNGVEGIALGDLVYCSVRPESVRLHPTDGPASTQVNQFAAEVQSIMYFGDSEQYSLRLADGRIVRAVEHTPTALTAEVGERVLLQIDPRDVVVFPQEKLDD